MSCRILGCVLVVALGGIGTASGQAERSLSPPDPPRYVPAADGQLGSTLAVDPVASPPTKPKGPPQRELVVRPAAEPVPALSHRLWPKERGLRSGSAQLHYYRALSHYLLLTAEAKKEINDRWFQDEPKGDAEARRKDIQRLAPIYDELHQLALSEDFKWDHRWRHVEGPDIYHYMLHDVQESRSLARLLVLKIDEHLAQRDFEGVISTATDGYRLAAFICNGETLVQQLVGIAIAEIINHRVEAAIATPGCPNLYWALATLPPLSNMPRALEIELGNLPRIFPVLQKAEWEKHDEAYWNEAWKDICTSMTELGAGENDVRLAQALAPVKFLKTARERLIKRGRERAEVEAMPAMRAVLLDAYFELAIIRDELAKGSLLPYSTSRALILREDKELEKWIEEDEKGSVAGLLASLLLPAIVSAREAEVRLMYNHRQLMNIEALRMHAAAHQGALPQSIDDVEIVPTLEDPFSGKSVSYERKQVDGKTVIVLDGDLPKRYKHISQITVRFEPNDE